MTDEQQEFLETAKNLADSIVEQEAVGDTEACSECEKLKEELAGSCVRCGLPYKQKELHVSEEDKQEYFRRILANQPYSKTYQLFGGQLQITIENLTSKESVYLNRVMQSLAGTEESEIESKIIRLKGVSYLRAICDKTFEVPPLTESTTVEDLLALWDERTGHMNEDMIVILVQTLHHHYGYLNALSKSAFDPNFWKGAGYV